MQAIRPQPSPTTATLREIPSGAAGTRETLRLMRQLVRRYKKNMPLRQLALSIVENVPGHKNFAGQVRAIHSYMKKNIRFVRDIRGVETLATPIKTLEFRQGDCDDQSVLIATLLESIGHPTRFVAIKLKQFSPFVHVYVETKIGPRWVPVETTEPWKVGQGPPMKVFRMVVEN